MRRYDLDNYNTIQPKLTYKSPIVRNKTLHQQVPLYIKEKEEFNEAEILNNKIEKTLTKAIPHHHHHNNIQSAR